MSNILYLPPYFLVSLFQDWIPIKFLWFGFSILQQNRLNRNAFHHIQTITCQKFEVTVKSTLKDIVITKTLLVLRSRDNLKGGNRKIKYKVLSEQFMNVILHFMLERLITKNSRIKVIWRLVNNKMVIMWYHSCVTNES